MTTSPASQAEPIKRGDTVVLQEKPDGCTSRHYQLTVGRRYQCLDFEGSNIVTTTDVPGERESYYIGRVRRATGHGGDR